MSQAYSFVWEKAKALRLKKKTGVELNTIIIKKNDSNEHDICILVGKGNDKSVDLIIN